MENKKIITMEDIANVLRICDSYLNNKYNTNLIELTQINIDNKVETILTILLANSDIANLFVTYNLYELMYEILSNYCKNKICNLSNEALIVSRKSASRIDLQEFTVTEERLDKIFETLEHNMELYEKLYKDKIWIIDSSIGKRERLKISPERFFHLMGFEEKDFSRKYNPGALDKFSSIYSNSNKIKSMLTDKKDLYGLLIYMLEKENQNLKDAILSGKLHGVLNPQKIEMKNYSFERMGLVEHSSGIIFFDRNLAEQVAGYDERGKSKFKTNIHGDLILLSNFIRNYKLDFIFEPFKFYPRENKQESQIFKDAESIFIPEKSYEESLLYKGQQSSISERAKRYNPKDFEYTIRLENGEEIPTGDPDMFVEFDEEDKARMAESIITNLPQLNNEHLKEVYNIIMNDLSNSKGFKR